MQFSRRTRMTIAAASILAVSIAVGPVFPMAGAEPVSGAVDPPEGLSGVHAFMLELEQPAAAASYTRSLSRGAGRADAGRAARAQHARNRTAQAETLAAFGKTARGVRPLFQVQSAYNGIAIQADARDVPALRELPNVKAIHLIPIVHRENAGGVPLIAAPAVWKDLGLDGEGIRIGIIDTGIDYVHTNFGGTGSSEDLTTARSALHNPLSPGLRIDPAFTVPGASGQLYPSGKVVGGWDFAGDAYDANSANATYSPVPAPDPNPVDCPTSLGGGHGTHVAGTAGGYGVNANGTTYAGPWDDTVPFETLRIGPGVAPAAELFALRVFGCAGSTALTTAAIDWAVDPNGDGDPSDRLDVINMSLGSGFGSPFDASAVAATNAAAAGVVVVASAGNSGDVYYITGSPGASTRTISVAAGVDDLDVVDGFRIEPPAAIAGTYPGSRSANFDWEALTPFTAPLYYPATNQTGCAAWTGTDLTNIAGKVVLVDWRTGTNTTSPCGSTVRANNASSAGALGIVMADNIPFIDVAISGNATTPALFTTSTVGAALKSALTPGAVSAVQAYLSDEFAASVRLVAPGRADTLPSFTSRGPGGIVNGLKPDVTAPGQGIFSAEAGTGSKGWLLNGTSMAAPHVAGVLALLRQAHPEWSVEELKALAMNYAGHDLFTGLSQTGTKYAPARAGSGRVDAGKSANGAVIAYAADDPGAVGVSFGALEVLGSGQYDRNVTVSNKGLVSATYDLSTEARTAIPGVSISTSVPSVTVAPGASSTFQLRLTADAALMKNARDATVPSTQGGNPRQFLSEASGVLFLTPTAGATQALRLPYYATARPASQMTASPERLVFPADTGASLPLTLAGTGVNTGASYPTDYLSLVSAFELAHVSPELNLAPGVPDAVRNADLRYVGVTATRTSAANPSRVNNSRIYFGIATHASWSTPASEVEFDVFLDTNRDGTDDFVLYSTRFTGTDVLVAYLQPLPSGTGTAAFLNSFSPASYATAVFNTNVVILDVAAGSLNMGTSNTRFNYRVQTYSRLRGAVDATGWMTFDYAAPGLDFLAASTGSPIFSDNPGGGPSVAFNGPAYRENGSQGALLFHHFNVGPLAKTQVIPVGCPAVAFTAVPALVCSASAGNVASVTDAGVGAAYAWQVTNGVITGGQGTPEITFTAGASGSLQLQVTVTPSGGCAPAQLDTDVEIRAVCLEPVPTPIVVGATNTFKGSGFTAGTVLKLFVSTSGGPVDTNLAGWTPTSWTPTTLTWDIPANVPLGQGFGSLQAVNTDQGYASSNVVGQLLYGDEADGLPTILGVDGIGLSGYDPSIPGAHVETVLAPGAAVTISGTGFDAPLVNLYTASGNAGPLAPLAGGNATSFYVVIPGSVPAGPGSFQVVNTGAGYTVSNAVAAVLRARIEVTSVSVSGSTVTVTGDGFCSLTAINLFNAQGGGVVNLGGLQPGGTPVIPLTIVSAQQLTFELPAGAQAGSAYVQALNPPYTPFTSSGTDPGGAFNIP
jgi:subtilisin family serine protease